MNHSEHRECPTGDTQTATHALSLEAYTDLLRQERQAALGADVGALVAIQDAKRTIMDQILASNAPAMDNAQLEQWARLSQSNIALIRHLSQCLHSMAEGTVSAATGHPQPYQAQGYTRQGVQPQSTAEGQRYRGALRNRGTL